MTRLIRRQVSLLLILYGAGSIWLHQPALSPGSIRAAACQLWLCADQSADSPVDFEPATHLSLAQANAHLIREPASAYRWADLADAEMNADHIDHGTYCVRQALGAAPVTPAILFRAANLYLRLADYPETLRNLGAMLRNPELAGSYDRVFTLYSQMDLPLQDLLNQGLPRTAMPVAAFLNFWIRQDKLEEAQETWNWITQNSLATAETASAFATLLAKAAHWEEAFTAWSGFATSLDDNYTTSNWLYNGSFEMIPSDCPFDWHLQSDANVTVRRDLETSYKGIDSLRVTLSGTPPAPRALAYQTVMLPPGAWQVSAAMKSRYLTGHQGVVIRVVDQDDPAQLDVSTSSFEGTEEWREVTTPFVVTAKTRTIRLEILRPAEAGSNTSLNGTEWIDEVKVFRSVNTGGLTQPGEPCESHHECRARETGFEAASKNSS